MSGNPTTFLQPLLEAVAHQQAGRLEDAASGFAAVLAIEPNQPQALLFAGVIAHRRGRFAQALELLRQAAAVRPSDAETRFALGNALWSAGQSGSARQEWEATLKLARRHVGAMLNIARAQELDGDATAAVITCRGAVACQRDLPAPRVALASALRAADMLEASLEVADSAVALAPAFAPAHYQRGTTLKALGRLPEAEAAFRDALRLDPDDASSHLNLANVLFDLSDPVSAEAHCRSAIAVDPAMAEAHAALGYFLTESGHLAEAVAACETAIKLQPDLADAHWNMGIALLTAGNLPRGFACYEWRKRHKRYGKQFRSLPTPEWDGGPLAGKRLLVLCEQGLGDAIMFGRYGQKLSEIGATVLFACDRRLIPLLQGMPGIAAAVPNGRDLPQHDLWVDQMSLPHLCGTTLETIPPPVPPPALDRSRLEAWRPLLPARDGDRLRVGIAWAGNPLHSNDHNRSCPSAVFGRLIAETGLQAVSLQVGERAAEALSLGIANLAPRLTDFRETEAVIAQLDLVVTVDTSVAHLAASMGKPTWIMLAHCPEWRWLRDRSDSPWYPSVRLFRQPSPGDWNACAEAIIAALKQPALATA